MMLLQVHVGSIHVTIEAIAGQQPYECVIPFRFAYQIACDSCAACAVVSGRAQASLTIA